MTTLFLQKIRLFFIFPVISLKIELFITLDNKDHFIPFITMVDILGFEREEIEEGLIIQLMGYSHISRKYGLLMLEDLIFNEDEPIPFLQKILQLIVDGTDPNKIETISEIEMKTSLRLLKDNFKRHRYP